jgi:hypothetical protein
MHRVPVDDQSRAEKDEVERAARGGFTGRQVARGNLAAQPFPEVLAQLYRWRSTGALLIRRDKVKKIVHLKDGYPVLVKSNLLSECLGRIMVRERMITEADCETSIQRMKETGRQQGTLLIEAGTISPHNLAFALQMQLETKLYEVFGWLGGDYQFNPQADLPPSPVALDHSPATLILEGIKRCWSSERIKQHLHGQMDQFAVPHPEPLQGLQDLRLTEKEQAFAALMDGSRSLRELTAISPLTPLQTWWLLYGMVASQMVALARVPVAGDRTVRSGPPPGLPVAPPPLAAPAAAAPSVPPPLPRAPSAGSAGSVALSGVSVTRTDVDRVVVAPRLATQPTVMVAPERDRIESLTRRVKEMRRQNYFEMLGISKTAGTDEIRKAYFAQAKDFHPDKHHGVSSSELKALADQVYSMLSTAYECLADAREREDYARGLNSGVKSGVTDEVGRILQAEAAFQRGETHAKRREWHKAAQAFEQAVKLYPQEGEFHAHVGWAVFQQDTSRNAAAAQRHMERGLELSPRFDRGYVFLGTLFKMTGRPQLAEQQFERAIQCNPDCTDALRELRLLHEAARQKAKG